MPYRIIGLRFVLALLITLCGTCAVAQEPIFEPHQTEPARDRPSDATKNGGAIDAQGHVILPPGHINLSPEQLRENRALFANSASAPKYILWKRANDSLKGTVYKAYQVENGAASTSHVLTQKEVEDFYRSALPVVNIGDVPKGANWQKLTATHGDKVVIHEPASANKGWNEIAEATALGGKPLDPATTKVFNALPQETDMDASRRELGRMHIVGTGREWEAVNERIKTAAAGFPSQVASKEALLHELHHGHSSVIVVYAHFDGEHLYMPGANGSTLSVEEIAKIDRTNDPLVKNRVIVLAACNTAAAASYSQSLASVLLQKGIARTVLATDRPYDARDIPALMARLKGQISLRPAGGQLRQYVELGYPNRLLHPSFGMIEEREVFSGE